MPRPQPSIRAQFGQRVRELLAAANLTQEKLAFRSDLDRSYVGQIERGEVNVSIDNVGKLARGLRVAVKALFEFSPMA
jgi:transcriptional regulator with XRE-family HTH domain